MILSFVVSRPRVKDEKNRDENVKKGKKKKKKKYVARAVARIYRYSIITSQARRAKGFVYSLFYLFTAYKTRRVNYFPVDPVPDTPLNI